MSEFKGTPGPWGSMQQLGVPRDCSVMDGLFSYRAEVLTCGGSLALIALADDPEVATANARLVSAAPDLLAACQDLLSHASVTEHMSANSVEQARAAVAKALGQSQ